MNTNINLALYVQSNFNCKSDIFNIFEMLYNHNYIKYKKYLGSLSY